MRKTLIFLVLLCFIFTLTACKQPPVPSDTQSDETFNGTDENDTSSNNGETYDSASNKDELPDTSSDILALPLSEAYAYAVKQYEEHAESHRDIGELQIETQQIIEIGGKYYQSYVASNVDIRYVFISQPEFPDKGTALWDWYTVGTANVYSLELLGKIGEDLK